MNCCIIVLVLVVVMVVVVVQNLKVSHDFGYLIVVMRITLKWL